MKINRDQRSIINQTMISIIVFTITVLTILSHKLSSYIISPIVALLQISGQLDNVGQNTVKLAYKGKVKHTKIGSDMNRRMADI